MKRFALLTFILITSSAFAQEAPAQDDPYRVDMRIENLNSLYREMSGTEVKMELADDSYYTLNKPEANKLLVTVMLYNPADETHYMAYEAEYHWNEDVGTLIADVCKEAQPPILPPKVEPFCEEGIMKASEMISLQLWGVANYDQYYDMENLENCVADKLPPKMVEKPYLRCMINVMGDKKYAQESLDAKIKEFEAKGYECESNGECVKAEDPEVFAKILSELRGEKVAVEIPNDSRPRYCDLRTVPLTLNPDNSVEYIESYEPSCNYWVNAVYCKSVENRLFWAVEYVDAKGHEEIFHTFPFDVAQADKTIQIPWQQDVRLNRIEFFMNPAEQYTVDEIQFNFSQRMLPVVCSRNNSVNRADLTQGKIDLTGELGGFHFARLAGGVQIKSVIERT